MKGQIGAACLRIGAGCQQRKCWRQPFDTDMVGIKGHQILA